MHGGVGRDIDAARKGPSVEIGRRDGLKIRCGLPRVPVRVRGGPRCFSGQGGTMKVLETLCLGIALAAVRPEALAQSGWYQQPPWPTTENLLAVATPDLVTIVAVGYRGAIVRSNDGGET